MQGPDTEANGAPDRFECGHVVASDRGLIEVENRKLLQLVPRDSIKTISLKFGSAAYHPRLEITIGLMLATIGAIGIFGILFSPRGFRYEIGMILFGGIGIYTILFAIRKHHYLLVETDKRKYKLRFSQNAKMTDIIAFCDKIKEKWGYQLDTEI